MSKVQPFKWIGDTVKNLAPAAAQYFIPGLGGTAAAIALDGMLGGHNNSQPQGNDAYNQANQQWADAFAQDAPKAIEARRKAAEYLDPANDSTLAQLVSNQNDGTARSSGMTQKNYLARQGYGSGAYDGAVLDAMNKAQEASNNFISYLYSPRSKAERYQSISQILSDPSVGQKIQGIISDADRMRMTRATFDQSMKEPSLLEQLLGSPAFSDILFGNQNQGNIQGGQFYNSPIGPDPLGEQYRGLSLPPVNDPYQSPNWQDPSQYRFYNG